MAFQVFLMPTTASPPAAQVQAEVRKAIVTEGGAVAADGLSARTAEETRFGLADGDRFAIDQLSPGLCKIIFKAAVETDSMVGRGGDDVTSLRMKGVKGVSPHVRMRTDRIAGPQSLCVRLSRDLLAWNALVSNEQAGGLMDRNQNFLGPPASPGAEARLLSDPSGIAARCLAFATPSPGKRGWTIRLTIISQNPQYGVVWRADATQRHPDSPSRLICWRLPGSKRIVLKARALEMLDPKESVGALQAETPSPLPFAPIPPR